MTPHDEVLEALQAIGNPSYGEAIRKDRQSELLYLGISFPALRARVKQGFSFTNQPSELSIWNDLWQESAYGDVLFAALERLRMLKKIPPVTWETTRHWADRVDNWCHSDALSKLYARLLHEQLRTASLTPVGQGAGDGDSQSPSPQRGEGTGVRGEAPGNDILNQLKIWNEGESLWHKRLSLTSLLYRKTLVVPIQIALPFLENALDDRRHYIQLALGWFLRDVRAEHPDEILTFIDAHGSQMGAKALGRANEKIKRLG